MKKIFLSLLLIVCFYAVKAQADSLMEYAGTYVFPEGNVIPSVDVKSESGALSMSSVAGNSSLTRSGIDSFTIVEFSGMAVFRRGEDKKIDGVHIEAAGYIMDGKKQQNGIWIFTSYYLPANTELKMQRP